MKKISFKEYFENFRKKEESNEEKPKINKEKVKEVALIIVAIFLFVFGYSNYNTKNYENKKDEIAIVENENADMIGDVELVNSGSVVDNEITVGAVVENTEEYNNIEKSVSYESDYFENVRIDRDAMYSRMLETYNKMIDNKNLVETQKAIAVQEIEKITNNQNAIMIAENLIKNKGFEDVVVLANSDIINVIVKSSVLTNEDIGKIQNIIEREFKVSLENVNISNKF